ncbi:MAG TPA: AI-2E family transporter [Candidatus Limnocylindria bacterium]|nr:AI-2E family transporter [Candidatus Limnocylindria bacterium]
MSLSARERQFLSALVILAIAFLAIEIFQRLYEAFVRVADVFVIFVVAWAVAYLLAPLVVALDRNTRLDRLGAVLVVYAVLALLITGLLAIVIPPLASQLGAIQERAPALAENARSLATDVQQALARFGLQVDLAQAIGGLPQRIADTAGSIAADVLGVVSATAALLFNVTLVLIIAFLMLLDGPALWARFLRPLSPELRSEAELFRQSADRSFGGFIRGSLILGVVYAIATLAYLVPLGVPFAGVLAVVAGLTVIIPFFGPIIAIIPVMVITLLGAPESTIAVLVMTLVLQQVTLNIVGPRVIGDAVGVHPLFVFLALLLGSRIAGFWGVLLALPVAGIVATFLRYAYDLAQGRRARTEAAAVK